MSKPGSSNETVNVNVDNLREDTLKDLIGKNVYVGNLNPSVAENDLVSLFEKFGKVVDVFISICENSNRSTPKLTCAAYLKIVWNSDETANDAIKTLDGSTVGDTVNMIQVRLSCFTTLILNNFI
jgi:RNA recognition motif-containing protein